METQEFARIMTRRAEATGMSVAAITIPYSFQRTLMTRNNLDQALVTGLSFTIGQAVASAIQESIQSGALLVTGDAGSDADVDLERWSRFAMGMDLAAIAAGMGIQVAFRQRPGERLNRGAARTAGQVLAVTGGAGTAMGAVQEAVDFSGGWKGAVAAATLTGAVAGQREWHRRRSEARLTDDGVEPSEVSGLRSLAMAAGVGLGASLVGRVEGAIAGRVARGAARVLPGNEALWRPLGHAASLALIAGGLRAVAQRIFHMIEGREFAVEPAIDVPPLQSEVSGSPGSAVGFRSLAKMGRRFVWTTRIPSIIEEVTGEPARAHPIRVYVGLKSAPTIEERVRLAIEELDRTGAFERSWLMISTPTGTGYANYAAAGALEFLSRGDCANVALQYGARPSPISLDRVDDGREQMRAFFDALRRKLDELPEGRRPTVVLFGESLGAWASQDAFIDRGTDGLIEAGVDYAIWIGTPMESKWKEQVLRDDRPDVDRSLIGVFNDIDQWKELLPAERERIRYVMITHYNDGVAVFGPALAVQAPEWLGEPSTRPPGVPRSMRWIPITTFVQLLIDTKNAARVVPGIFEADGHDYRADLVPFFSAVLGFDASPELQTAIVKALEKEESRRTRWIKERGKVGESMAAVILDKVRAQDPETFYEAVRSLESDFVAEEEREEGSGVPRA